MFNNPEFPKYSPWTVKEFDPLEVHDLLAETFGGEKVKAPSEKKDLLTKLFTAKFSHKETCVDHKPVLNESGARYREFITTEHQYINALHILTPHKMGKLIKAYEQNEDCKEEVCKENGCITKDEFIEIFELLKPLRNHLIEFYDLLKKVNPDGCTLKLQEMEKFLIQFIIKVGPAKFPKSISTHGKIVESSKNKGNFVGGNRDPSAKGLNLQSILVKPYQRVIRYKMLINELISSFEKVDNKNPMQEKFKVLLDKLEEISTTLNSSMRKDGELREKEKLSEKIDSFNTTPNIETFNGIIQFLLKTKDIPLFDIETELFKNILNLKDNVNLLELKDELFLKLKSINTTEKRLIGIIALIKKRVMVEMELKHENDYCGAQHKPIDILLRKKVFLSLDETISELKRDLQKQENRVLEEELSFLLATKMEIDNQRGSVNVYNAFNKATARHDDRKSTISDSVTFRVKNNELLQLHDTYKPENGGPNEVNMEIIKQVLSGGDLRESAKEKEKEKEHKL